MSEKRYKRFYVSESENQLTIYDNEGLDDYYHLGSDERDVKGICKLLNEQQDIIKKQCNHKKAILDFLKFMKMDNPLMEIMVDEFLEEVWVLIDDE